MTENSKNVYSACFLSGARYVAMCEGDDYWTDQDKLQKQVDFLDNHPDFVLCAGNSKVIYDNEPKRIESFRPDWSDCKLEVLTIEDQIKLESTYQTSTAMFRNLFDFSKLQIPISGDIVIFTLLADKGNLFFMNEFLSCYRVHSGGVSNPRRTYNQLKEKYLKKIELYTYMNKLLNYRYANLYMQYIEFYTRRLIKHLWEGRRIGALLKYVLENMTRRGVVRVLLSVVFLKIKKRTIFWLANA